MDVVRLRYMADQIARNFVALGHDNAVAATADHLIKFWDPRMKAAILEDDPAALSPVARDAVQLLARGRKLAPQTHATEFNAVDEAGHSDAG
jgi:formate dehydrogenase subunit delta